MYGDLTTNCHEMPKIPTVEELVEMANHFEQMKNDSREELKRSLDEAGIPHVLYGDPIEAIALPMGVIEQVKEHSVVTPIYGLASLSGIRIIELDVALIKEAFSFDPPQTPMT